MCKLEDVTKRAVVHKGSVRYRLLAIALLPMLVILPLLLLVSIYRWNVKFDDVLISKVKDDLTIAHQYMGRILENTEEQLISVTHSARFQEALKKPSYVSDVGVLLKEITQSRGFDFLYVIGKGGRILASAHPIQSHLVRSNWPIISAAFDGRSKTGIDVFAQAELAAISSELAQQARIEIVPTKESSPTSRKEETRGLVLHSASPFVLSDGQPAALVGGILLNQNLAFVDTINDLIYHGAGLPQGSQGTATLFLDDVRISTNVRLFENQRALGTRVSNDVHDAVLDQGRTWLDSAFVVNDWYISGYEPIIDTYNRRAGMLYAGFLQKPFTDAKRQTLLEIALAFLIAVIATVPLFLRWASDIFRPIERMTTTIARVKKGELDARTGHVDVQDEIGQVATHLDRLLDKLHERDVRLRHWNEELNMRVKERTHNLQLANQKLETTTRQLIMSDKLAAIGEITAGVAHEINNPIAVMQGNLEVIRELMGSQAELAETEFRLLDEQLQRISEIVTKLLQFAKPQEYANVSVPYGVSDIVRDTLPLIQHLLNKTTIKVLHEYHATRFILMNKTELQQVLVNLMINAIHAMPTGGKLILRTFDRVEDESDGVVIEVSDSGVGMTPDVMNRIFDPFFTTKRREGTGLGLSISQMLVARQGGKISVKSEAGEGTTFTIWLPEGYA